MSQAKHTAGPWRVDRRYFVESSADPKDIRAIGTVADCRPFATDNHPEAEANARLIAAAPAMLDELRDTALWLGSRVEVLLKLLADPAGWGRGQAATDKRQVIREEVARLQGRAFLIRQVIDKATAGA